MTSTAALPVPLRYEDLERAHRASSSVARRTPILTAASLSKQCGGTIALKAENLQRTGSFKLRGALNRLRHLRHLSGVVTGSAGNHGQSLAYAARAAGVECEVFMPVDAAVSKVAAVRAFGATVHAEGESVNECVELAKRRAADRGLSFVHPFDDLQVVAGQAGVGVELLEDVPDLVTAVVPVGGGGLIAGVAAAVKQRAPDVRIVGVQAAPCAATIADGIAVKRPGELTLPLMRTLVDDVVKVSEDAIAEAMVLLLERSKLVVEGAGAVALAALLGGAIDSPEEGTTALVLSGGNVDVGLLANVAFWQETRRGRRLRLYVRISDRPGGLAALLATVAATGTNILAVDHVRDSASLDVRETGIELTLETRGEEHAGVVCASLLCEGYRVEELN